MQYCKNVDSQQTVLGIQYAKPKWQEFFLVIDKFPKIYMEKQKTKIVKINSSENLHY